MSQNRFDQAAKNWDKKQRRLQIAQSIFQSITQEIPLDSSMEAMDYGCGTGLVTLALAPRVKSILGLDSSRGMIEAFSEKIKNEKIPNVRCALADLENGEALNERYDLIVSAMTFHHIKDPQALIEKFFALLRPGGYLAIADLDKEPGDFHDHGNDGVEHFGFDRQEMQQWFKKAGFDGNRAVTTHTVIKEDGRAYPIFLMVGHKP